MKYVDRVLGRDEQIIYETGLHWIVLLKPFAWFAVAAMILIFTSDPNKSLVALVFVSLFVLVGIGSLIRGLIDWFTTEIAVTTKRVIYKRGLISRDTIEINMNRVEGLDVKQTIMGRVLNFGTVVVRGTGLGSQPMHNIDAPIRLRNAAFEL